MLTSLIFAGVLALVTAIFYRHRSRSISPRVISDNRDAQIILKSPEYIRQRPNAWLITTLSIVNPFTIQDRCLREDFKNRIIKLLVTWKDEKNYQLLMTTMSARLQFRLGLCQASGSQFYLSTLVKQISLDAFLSGILRTHASEDLVSELPELIIHLWKNRTDQQAKDRLRELLVANQAKFSESEVWKDIQGVLSQHRDVIAQTVTNDFDEKISNPLNIIVPGWETMWRVVFYSLLELLRRPELLAELRQQLIEHSISYRQCHLLQRILKETLRLYPPTKNIYRANVNTGEDVCISVQQIHRDTAVWGADALQFRPDRFSAKLTEQQEKSYLPFSISCPARHGFAYDFAGALVATILKHCPTLSLTEKLPPCELLDVTRDSYKDLLVFNVWHWFPCAKLKCFLYIFCVCRTDKVERK